MMVMEIVANAGPIETNIYPHFQENESANGLVEVQVDPNELSQVIKIRQNINRELVV